MIASAVAVALLATAARGEEPVAPVADSAAPATVHFSADVLPLLRKNCLACHNEQLAEAGLSLESVAKITTGGDSGPAINVDDPPSSLLLTRARGTSDSIMPPEDNAAGAVPLTEDELGIVERWIAEGASDAAPAAPEALQWQPLPEDLRAVYAVAYAPVGGWFAVGRGNSIFLIDDATGQQIAILEDPALAAHSGADPAGTGPPASQIDFVNSLAIHPSGDLVASGDYRAVRIWRRNTAPVVRIDPARAREDDQAALLASLAATATPVDPPPASEEERNRASALDIGGALTQLAFSADKRFAITVADAGGARLWDWNEGRLIGALEFSGPADLVRRRLEGDVSRQKGHSEYISGLIPAAEALITKEEAARVAAEEAEKKARADVVANQTKVQEAETQLRMLVESTEPAPTDEQKAAAQKTVDDAKAALAAAETAVESAAQALAAATDTRDRATEALEALRNESQREQERLLQAQAALDAHNQSVAQSGTPTSIAFSPDASAVAFALPGGILAVFSTTDARPRGTLRGAPVETSRLRFVDANWLVASGAADAELCAWRLDQPWSLDRILGGIAGTSPFSGRVTALDFSPDGRHLVVGGGQPSRAGEVHVVDTASWEITATWDQLHSDSVFGVRVSPDGQTLATCGADRQIRLVDFPSGENERSFEGHTHHVLGVAWQDSGRRLASVSADNTIKIWDVRSGEAERTIAAGGKEVTSIAFTGTAPQFVTTAGDGAVRLYNADNGAVVRTFNAAVGFQYSVDVGPAGTQFVAGGYDGTVRLWKVDAVDPVHQIP